MVELIGGYDVAREADPPGHRAGQARGHRQQGAARAARRGDLRRGGRAGSTWPSRPASAAGFRSCARCARGSTRTIESVHGIMNGTTNYVLTEMEKTGEAFDVVLKRAQDLGYAEADPTFDVEGIDAAHKLTLLVAMAFGAELTYKEIPTEGISRPDPSTSSGRGVRLPDQAARHRQVAPRAGRVRERIEARVHPTMIPATACSPRRRRHERRGGHRRRRGPDALLRRGRRRAADRERRGGGPDRDRPRDSRRGSAGRVAPLSYCRAPARAEAAGPAGRARRGAATCASRPSIGPACWRTSPAPSASTRSASNR